jgi:hypothetical protein
MPRLVALIPLGLALALAACRTAGTVPAAIPTTRPAGWVDTGRLVPTEELGPAFSLHQRIAGRYGDRAVPTIDAVLQLHAGELSLVALTPFGTRALVIHQKGTDVTVETFVDKLPPLDPKAILRDIHRVLFRGLYVGAVAAGHPPSEGIHTGRDGGDRVTESWRAGRRQWRTLTPETDDPDAPPAVRIEFEGEGLIVAPTVRLENLRLGYQLVITTLAQERLGS